MACSNSHRSISSSMESQRSLQQRLQHVTRFSSSKICSHHVHNLFLSLYYCNLHNIDYRQHSSPSYINNRQYSQSSANISPEGGVIRCYCPPLFMNFHYLFNSNNTSCTLSMFMSRIIHHVSSFLPTNQPTSIIQN